MSNPTPAQGGALPVNFVCDFLFTLLRPAIHAKRAMAIARAAIATMHADRLSIAAIGRALARVYGIKAKNGIKQIDRLLGNSKFLLDEVFSVSVPWLVANRDQIVVSLDWTEYAKDGHSRIAVNLVTEHGRATPLVWKTHRTDELRDKRNEYEDRVLMTLTAYLPPSVHVTVLADRGFGDTKLYEYLEHDLGWDFVIRFRGNIRVRPQDGGCTTAAGLVARNGRVRGFEKAFVTAGKYEVGVVTVKRKGMKEAWCLATTLAGDPHAVVKLYQRRFTCEESFRDEKDRRFGLGSLETTVSTTDRRDRSLVLAMLATCALTLLGSAGERAGCDKDLRANTVTMRRTHSLFRQGREYLLGCSRDAHDFLGQMFVQLIEEHSRTNVTYAIL